MPAGGIALWARPDDGDIADTTLFEINRFSGYDLAEGGARANLGARATLALVLITALCNVARAQEDVTASASSSVQTESAQSRTEGTALPGGLWPQPGRSGTIT